MSYQIVTFIDANGLQRILSAGQKVALVKTVKGSASPGNLPVAWIAFSPLIRSEVMWQADYDIYATTTQLQPGAEIIETSRTSGARPGSIYTFQNGQFTGDPGSGDSYTVRNEQPGGFNFGLTQQANVDGRSIMSPVNAVPVLQSQQVSLIPEETVSVFLTSFGNSGVILSSVPGNALEVNLTAQNPTATLQYSQATGSFQLQSMSAGQS